MTPREAEPQISKFAKDTANAIHALADSRGISGRELARMIDRSNNYVAIRFRHEASFTLTDIEQIGDALGFEIGSFLAGITAAKLSNVVPLRKDEIPDNVEDFEEIRKVAQTKPLHSGEEPEDDDDV